MTRLHWVVAALSVAGCAGKAAPISAVDCTREADPAIRATILDRNTGSAPSGVTVWAISGTYRDSEPVFASGPALLAVERAGTYAVVASGVGYLQAATTGIIVSEGQCHVNTRQVTLWLVPDTAANSGGLTTR